MKLIDLLVQELPKRGGWPDAANYVVQDCDGTVKFSKSINFLHIKAGVWCSNKDGDDWIYGDRPFEGNFHHHTIAQDRNSSIVTRAQYEAALAASDGWIEWHGGECPVDSDAIVEVKYRKPNPYQYNNDRAGDFDWAHTGSSCDIIAYRLRNPEIKSHTNDNRLEQDLNECIGQDVDMPEWSGDGLPPSGIDIEYRLTKVNYRNDFSRGRVIAYGISNVFMEHWSSKNEFIQPLDKIEFRPLRTQAEKLRDEAGLALYHAINWNAEGELVSQSRMEDYKKAYDAIAAGKIPGVKLEGK